MSLKEKLLALVEQPISVYAIGLCTPRSSIWFRIPALCYNIALVEAKAKFHAQFGEPAVKVFNWYVDKKLTKAARVQFLMPELEEEVTK